MVRNQRATAATGAGVSGARPSSQRARPARRQERRGGGDRAERGAERELEGVAARGLDHRALCGERRTGRRAGEREEDRAAPPRPARDAGEPEERRAQPRREEAALPVRILGDRAAQREFLRAVGVEHAPEPADRPFEPALPRLVEPLDDAVAQALRRGGVRELADEPRLVDARRHRALAPPSPARPAGLADEHLLAREGRADAREDADYVVDRALDRHRLVFPVRQHVHGDERHRVGERRVLQPELPDVGVGDRERRRGADAPDVVRERGRRQLPAQQHLVADDHRVDRVGVAPDDFQPPRELALVLGPVAADPEPEQHAQAVLARERGHGVESLVDRVDAHAARPLREEREIGVDLRRADDEILGERRLPRETVRRVRHARQLLEVRVGQRDRLPARMPPRQPAERGEHRHDPHCDQARASSHTTNARLATLITVEDRIAAEKTPTSRR